MGVAGVGKSALARALAESLGWRFIEGDDFHPAGNVEKMRRGEALSEAERAPWLSRLREQVRRCVAAGDDAVLACSALKGAHRERLRADPGQMRFVYLSAPASLIRERLDERRGHFMPARLLESQLEALEPPADALTLDARRPIPDLVAAVRAALGPVAGSGP